MAYVTPKQDTVDTVIIVRPRNKDAVISVGIGLKILMNLKGHSILGKCDNSSSKATQFIQYRKSFLFPDFKLAVGSPIKSEWPSSGPDFKVRLRASSKCGADLNQNQFYFFFAQRIKEFAGVLDSDFDSPLPLGHSTLRTLDEGRAGCRVYLISAVALQSRAILAFHWSPISSNRRSAIPRHICAAKGSLPFSDAIPDRNNVFAESFLELPSFPWTSSDTINSHQGYAGWLMTS
jgi:hypothetical protein